MNGNELECKDVIQLFLVYNNSQDQTESKLKNITLIKHFHEVSFLIYTVRYLLSSVVFKKC